MPVNKNQHYVPQFYLRYFSYQGNSKQIGVFVPDACFSHPTTKIADECTLPYFYGKDGELDKEIKTIEDKAAKLLPQICATNTVPRRDSEHHSFLVFYAMLSMQRTALAAETVLESNKFIEEQLQPDPNEAFFKSFFDFSREDAIKLKLRVAFELYTVLMDLEIKLLVNKTAIPFVTSDSPVTMYNQLAEAKKALVPSYGYACLGIQLFFPINPQYCLIFYDSTTYKVGNRKDRVITVMDEKDIFDINRLQMLQCAKKVFFNHDLGKRELAKLTSSLTKHPRKNLSENNVADFLDNGGQVHKESLYVSSKPETRVKMALSFIKSITPHQSWHHDRANTRKAVSRLLDELYASLEVTHFML
ncbi:DUF4238 domain-containing protein [Dyadobacter sp. BHUBP1]|uniref:DUF4238 domain-containing protein n=1 Tax=Dyadobacter sp. BHUBP1 TaxID=3424178 RepID=UPI003D3356A9